MAFIRKQGKTKFMYFNWTASSGAIAAGALVMLSSGVIVKATSTAAAEIIVGVLRHAIATTDDNYATNHTVEVEVPAELNVIWTADTTATVAVTDVGIFCDLTDESTVNPDASTYDIAMLTKCLSTTKGEYILNIGCLASTT